MSAINKIAYVGVGLGVLWILGEMRQNYLANRGIILSSGCSGKQGACFDITPKLFRKKVGQSTGQPISTSNDLPLVINDKCQKQWDEMVFVKAPTDQERINFLADCRSRSNVIISSTVDTEVM